MPTINPLSNKLARIHAKDIDIRRTQSPSHSATSASLSSSRDAEINNPYVMSSRNCLKVDHWEPKIVSGAASELLTVHLTPTNDPIQLQLYANNTYLPTSARHTTKTRHIQLNTVVPSDLFQGSQLTLEIHGFRDGVLVDSCSVGAITVSGSECVPPSPVKHKKRLRSDSSSNRPSRGEEESTSSAAWVRLDEARPAPVVKKLKQDHSTVLQLQIEGDVEALSDESKWLPFERDIGRRLVRFSRTQVDDVITVSFKPVASSMPPSGIADLGRAGCVISCLLCPGQNQPVITSVDFVNLVALLVHPGIQKLSVDERNRVRRSLEVLRPTTIKKNDVKSAKTFNFLVDLPNPKPVNISKDIKIFPWALLSDGLSKILSKYAYNWANDTIFEHAMVDRRTSALRKRDSLPVRGGSRPAKSSNFEGIAAASEDLIRAQRRSRTKSTRTTSSSSSSTSAENSSILSRSPPSLAQRRPQLPPLKLSLPSHRRDTGQSSLRYEDDDYDDEASIGIQDHAHSRFVGDTTSSHLSPSPSMYGPTPTSTEFSIASGGSMFWSPTDEEHSFLSATTEVDAGFGHLSALPSFHSIKGQDTGDERLHALAWDRGSDGDEAPVKIEAEDEGDRGSVFETRPAPLALRERDQVSCRKEINHPSWCYHCALRSRSQLPASESGAPVIDQGGSRGSAEARDATSQRDNNNDTFNLAYTYGPHTALVESCSTLSDILGEQGLETLRRLNAEPSTHIEESYVRTQILTPVVDQSAMDLDPLEPPIAVLGIEEEGLESPIMSKVDELLESCSSSGPSRDPSWSPEQQSQVLVLPFTSARHSLRASSPSAWRSNSQDTSPIGLESL